MLIGRAKESNRVSFFKHVFSISRIFPFPIVCVLLFSLCVYGWVEIKYAQYNGGTHLVWGDECVSDCVPGVNIPLVSIQAASGISATGSTLNASILSDGLSSSTVRGFHYGQTTLYGSTASTTGTYGVDDFSIDISGLTCNTTYNYRAFAMNASGTGTSSNQTFTTSPCSATVLDGIINPNSYTVTDLQGSQSMSAIFDNDPLTHVLLQKPGSTNAGMLIDMGTTTAINRLYFTGTSTIFHDEWPGSTTLPPGKIMLWVGTTTNQAEMRFASEFLVPYDQGSPIDLEGDIRFSPIVGRYIRVELETRFNGCNYWYCGWTNGTTSATSIPWKVAEIEVYGFTGSDATAKQDVVILPPVSSQALSTAALELSYYIGRLTGKPVPIVRTSNVASVESEYPGTIYNLVNLATLAPNWNTMIINQGTGLLPDGVNVVRQGNRVDFKAWPYRNVLQSVWAFLREQGVVWSAADEHGDLIPDTGVDLNILPLQKPIVALYANFKANNLKPWPEYVYQVPRQDYLYFWRNGWTQSWNQVSIFDGAEIPVRPATGVPLHADYTEGFTGFPHNFSGVVPQRILNANPTWCGFVTSFNSRVCSEGGSPTFDMSNNDLIDWIVGKMVAVQASNPLNTNVTNSSYLSKVFQLLPMDGAAFDQGSASNVLNSPQQQNPVPYARRYSTSFSGSYYYFIDEIAKKAKAINPNISVGAMAYSDTWLPPPYSGQLSDNVRVEVGLYGSPNLPISSPVNAEIKRVFEYYRSIAASLTTYDWSLLHVDYWQPNPRMPVPMVTAIVEKAKYLLSIDALTGGTQATIGSLPYNPWNFYAYSRIRQNSPDEIESMATDQILDEFFTAYFSESATPMRAYYHAMEDWHQSNNVDLIYRGYASGVTAGSFPVAMLVEMKGYLEEAESLAQYWIIKERVKHMREGFNWLLQKRGLTEANLVNIPSYQVVGTDTTPVILNLSSAFVPNEAPYGNYGSINGFAWDFWSQGVIQKPVNFVQGGTYTIAITSKLFPSTQSNITSNMSVQVGSKFLGSTLINSKTATTTVYTVNIPSGYGIQDIGITTGPRNELNVLSIVVTRQEYAASRPVVMFDSVTLISTSSAVLSGTIVSNNNASSVARGFKYGRNSFYDFTSGSSGRFTEGAFNRTITSLECGQTYYVQAYAQNSLGTGTSTETSFDTLICPGVGITTSPITEITATSAVMNAIITHNGDEDVTEHGFAYGTSSNLSTVIATTTLGSYTGLGSVASPLASLTCGTTYYVRAYAINPADIGYGAIVSFTTSSCPPPPPDPDPDPDPDTDNGTSTDPGNGNGTTTDPGTGNGTSTDPGNGNGNGTSTDPGAGNGTSTDPDPDQQQGTTTSTTTPTQTNTGGGSGGGGFVSRTLASVGFVQEVEKVLVDSVVESGNAIIQQITSIITPRVPAIDMNQFGTRASSDLGLDISVPSDISVLPVELQDVIMDIPAVKLLISSLSASQFSVFSERSTLFIPALGSARVITDTYIEQQDSASLYPNVMFARAEGADAYTVQLERYATRNINQVIYTTPERPIYIALQPDAPATFIRGYLIASSTSRTSVISTGIPTYLSAPIASLLGSNESLDFLPQGDLIDSFFIRKGLKDEIYTTQIDSPSIPGEYELIALVQHKDKEKGVQKIPIIVDVDAGGTVVTRKKGKRIPVEQAHVSLLKKDEVTGEFMPMNDPVKTKLTESTEGSSEEGVSGILPAQDGYIQTTGTQGLYTFFVPAGTYKMSATADGYFDYESKEIYISEHRAITHEIELRKKKWWVAFWLWIMGLF